MEHKVYGLTVKEAEKALKDFACKLRAIEEKHGISFIIPKLSLYQKVVRFFRNLL